MAAQPAPERVHYNFNPSFILLVASLLAFIAAFCEAEGWLTKGLFQEWLSAGLALYVLAQIA